MPVVSAPVTPCTLRVTPAGMRRLFEALEERGCSPRWTVGGGIIATCPSCREPDGLTVTLLDPEEVSS